MLAHFEGCDGNDTGAARGAAFGADGADGEHALRIPRNYAESDDNPLAGYFALVADQFLRIMKMILAREAGMTDNGVLDRSAATEFKIRTINMHD